MAINTYQADNGGGGGSGGGDAPYEQQQVTPGENVGWGSQVYQPRLSEPVASNKNWIKTTHGGWSLCIIPNPVKGQHYAPRTIPNCVSYAWGRARELSLQWNTPWPNNRFGNPPVMWRNYKSWPKGSVPRLGAMVCWYNKTDPARKAGHIAVVEGLSYKSNGKLDYFLISHSGYPTATNSWGNPPKYTRWTTKKIYASQNFSYSKNYPLLGFFYPPYCGLFSKDCGNGITDDANGYCGNSIITVYYKNPETGEYEPIQGDGNGTYTPATSGIPETPEIPKPPEITYKPGSTVKVKGTGNTSKLGTGQEVSCIGSTYQIKSTHPGFPYMYRIGTETRGIGYFKETDLEAV